MPLERFTEWLEGKRSDEEEEEEIDDLKDLHGMGFEGFDGKGLVTENHLQYHKQMPSKTEDFKTFTQKSPSVGCDYKQEEKEEDFVQELRSNYPNEEEERLVKIKNILMADEFQHTPLHEELANLWLEKNLTVEELEFIHVLFHNKIESATRDGISVIRSASGVEIRKNGDVKYIDSDSEANLKRLAEACDVYGVSEIIFDTSKKKKPMVNSQYGTTTFPGTVTFDGSDDTMTVDTLTEKMGESKHRRKKNCR